MDIGFVFWLLMLLSLLFWGAWGWGGSAMLAARGPWGYGFFIFLLFFLLGWKVFGFMIHG